MVIIMEKLFRKLKIEPKNLELYETAFLHTSYSNEHKNKRNYERLEFLGDAIVDLVVADYFYSNKNISEGEMTKLRASYVCENALAVYSDSLNLSEYVKVGVGEEHAGGKHRKTIIADIFEALMAAIYLDLGYATVRRTILNIVVPFIENPAINFFSDYKSALQEYVQTTQKSLVYELVNESGPSHDKVYTVAVKIGDIEYATGTASSKKEAEQEAAKNALNKLAV